MGRPYILILDFDSSLNMGDAFYKIIESSSTLDIQVHYEQVDAIDPEHSCDHILKIINRHMPGLVVLNMISINYETSKKTVELIRNNFRMLPIVIVVEESNVDRISSLSNVGIIDFIIPPLKEVDVIARLRRLIEQSYRQSGLMYRLKEKIGLKQIVGKHPVFLDEINKIPYVAQCDANVLIKGETGTGKELVARAIHYLSSRFDGPFITVNCGAIPADLVENELFGHIRGAFTSASTNQRGIVHEADGGTLLLDEVDCLPLSAQVKLLRLLQEKEYKQLGSSQIMRADVRIIAASNSDLEMAVKRQSFRPDLYYRLNIIPIELPPLRERKEDIPLLASHFLNKHAIELNKPVGQITHEAVQRLLMYDWPGNVRELEHIIERAVVFSTGDVIRSEEISITANDSGETQETFKEAKTRAINRFEVEYIQNLLIANEGNISRAARAAQKNRRAFWELIRKHNIDTQMFKSDHL